jgi:hypothetical protein
MKAIYDNKVVEVVKLVTINSGYITHPVLTQVKIQWKEDGESVEDYVDSNKVEFLNQ